MNKKIPSIILAFTMIMSCFVKDGNSSLLTINPEFGMVREVMNIDSAQVYPHLILIEDAHCFEDVQLNIVRILENLQKNMNERLFIATEGAFDQDAAADVLTKADLSDEILLQMLKDGNLSAAEYFYAKNDNVYLYGADDEELYKRNLEAYGYYLDSSNEQNLELQKIEEYLDGICSLVFTDDLRNLRENYQNWKKGEGDVREFAYQLKLAAGQYGFDLTGYEELLSFLHGPGELLSLIEEDEFQKELEDYRAHTSVDYDFDNTYADLSDDIKVALRSFPKLKKYALLNEDVKKVDHNLILKDADSVFDGVCMLMTDTVAARQALFYSWSFELLKRLLLLELKQEEFEQAENIINSDYADSLESYLCSYRPRFKLENDFASLIARRKAFYGFALKRDESIVNRLLDAFESGLTQDAGDVVLIVGGYHRKGICKLLREKKISYTVVTPTIAGPVEKAKEVYAAAMTRSVKAVLGRKK